MNTTVTNIESKTQLNKYISFKSLIFMFIYMSFAISLKDNVNDMISLPFLLFHGMCSFFFILPSFYNKGRNNIESIAILLISMGENKVYRGYY